MFEVWKVLKISEIALCREHSETVEKMLANIWRGMGSELGVGSGTEGMGRRREGKRNKEPFYSLLLDCV